jgi:hypothetical protein
VLEAPSDYSGQSAVILGDAVSTAKRSAWLEAAPGLHTIMELHLPGAFGFEAVGGFKNLEHLDIPALRVKSLAPIVSLNKLKSFHMLYSKSLSDPHSAGEWKELPMPLH